jgi:uncharacterized protein (UPF0548 family)
VFSLTAPREDDVRRFISKQKDSSFSYPDVGASATAVPAGYNLDHNRVQLGRGENTWQRGLGAIRAWRMFSMPWVNLHWQSAPIMVGTDIAVSVHHFGFYSLNACRIVYLVDDEGAVKRFWLCLWDLSGTCRERRRAIHRRMEPCRRHGMV